MEITQGVSFDSFGLSEASMRAVRNKGYTISTPVQAGCIPPMMEGKDVIAKAPTGTGKTMAFGIPIIESIDPASEKVQAIILAPTRELAIQITDEMREVAVCHEGVRIVCLYGGQPIGKQIEALKRRPQIVVATPGRLSDHMKRRTVVHHLPLCKARQGAVSRHHHRQRERHSLLHQLFPPARGLYRGHLHRSGDPGRAADPVHLRHRIPRLPGREAA